MAIPEHVRSPALGCNQIKLISAHNAHGHFAGGAAGNGGAGADNGGSEVSDKTAEGGAGRGDGVIPGLLRALGGRCFRAIDTLQTVSIIRIQRQRDDTAVHLQGAHLQFQPIADFADSFLQRPVLPPKF